MYKCNLFIAVDDPVFRIYSNIIVSFLLQLEEVRQHLRSLKRRRYVVLHGMTGCGKSCLAAAALDNKELVIEQFKVSIIDHSDCNI
jgi:DNA replication protein DnaC